LILTILQLLFQGVGLSLIDPDSKTADDTMAHIAAYAERLNPLALRNIYYLNPSTGVTFSYDPCATKLTGRDYDNWLYTRIEAIARIFGRKQGIANYKDQMRRDRVLRDVLYMCCTKGKDGKYFGLHRLFDCLNMGNDNRLKMFNRVCDFLPTYIARDLWRINKMSVRDRYYEIESTLNIVTAFLSPLVVEMLSGKAPTLDIHSIVRNNGTILAGLSETTGFSKENGCAIGSMLINDIEDACYAIKQRHFLIVEESDKMLGQDIGDLLRRARKRKLSVILSAGSLGAFKQL